MGKSTLRPESRYESSGDDIEEQLASGALQDMKEFPEEEQLPWGESEADGTISVENYLQRCRWRIGNVSHALDAIKANLATDSQAVEWWELKAVASAAKDITDPVKASDVVIELEHAGYDFAKKHNIDMIKFEASRNR